ncbi:GNAT family N-acetyltransferase [Microbispora sp. GKU 823]|uniref:GNAT family N-acetyltransferase n=1 Tax=Microbispora sp. GKU 823 TaxID=1652100 RepID=UPI0009A33685|nr:GNAT family N-acetyltransferase [Microbispora sp. GKU 823]OPG13440.1 GNAT family N-acetyltransferase [Microbispora sp. GKU 823]
MSGLGDLRLRELHTIEEFEDVWRLFGGIWRPDPGGEPVTVEMMRALSHAGNYVAGAFRRDRLVGASVGFVAAPPRRALHSHVTGTLAGQGVGFALKLHQREWALDRGLETITWTYDPLVRRNAHFNLAKLGARPEEYLPAFYGTMGDAINAGDESDRVLAVWPLTSPHVLAAVRGEPSPVEVPPDAATGLDDDDGRPVRRRTDAETVLVAVPGDIETLRVTDPAAARAWRLALREVLGDLLREGARVTGFHDKSCYVVRRGARDEGRGGDGRALS